MNPGQKIHVCRERTALSQEALADQLGVSVQTLSDWEAGRAEPNLTQLRLLSTLFGVSADWLLSENPDWPDDDAVVRPSMHPAWMRSIRMLVFPGAVLTLMGLLMWLLLCLIWKSLDRQYPFSSAQNPILILSVILMAIGLLLLSIGLIRTAILRSRHR